MKTNNIIPEIMDNLETTEMIDNSMRKFKLPEFDKESIILGIAIGNVATMIGYRVVAPRVNKLTEKIADRVFKKQVKEIGAGEIPVEEEAAKE